MDAATRHREAAAALGKRGDWLLTEFAVWGKGLAAMARQQALRETPAPREAATKAQRKGYEGAVERRVQPYTQQTVWKLACPRALRPALTRRSDRRPDSAEYDLSRLRAASCGVEADTRGDFGPKRSAYPDQSAATMASTPRMLMARRRL